MADLAHDAMYHVYFVPTIANPSAPTTANSPRAPGSTLACRRPG